MATTGTRSAARSAAARLAGLVALTFAPGGHARPRRVRGGLPRPHDHQDLGRRRHALGRRPIHLHAHRVQRRHATAHGVIVSDNFPTGVEARHGHRPAPGNLHRDEFATPLRRRRTRLYCELDPLDPGSIVTIPFEVKLDHDVQLRRAQEHGHGEGERRAGRHDDDNASSVTNDVAASRRSPWRRPRRLVCAHRRVRPLHDACAQQRTDVARLRRSQPGPAAPPFGSAMATAIAARRSARVWTFGVRGMSTLATQDR